MSCTSIKLAAIPNRRGSFGDSVPLLIVNEIYWCASKERFLDALAGCVVNVSRRAATVHCEHAPFGIVGVAVGTIVQDISGSIIGKAGAAAKEASTYPE